MEYTHIVFNIDGIFTHTDSCVLHSVQKTLESLVYAGFKLGIVTSKSKEEFDADLFEIIICADDATEDKPFASPLMKYMELTHTAHSQILYVGSHKNDMLCAEKSEIDFALAGWSTDLSNKAEPKYYLGKPEDLFQILFSNEKGNFIYQWLQRAMELQFIAQAGLTYSKDNFDIERFQRIREISAEILCDYTDYDTEKINEIFCNETGFQTPKLDTRAAVFEEDKILMVKELDGRWALPGGWVDVDQSVYSNTVKEVKEETGFNVIPVRIIAVQDRNKHNIPIYAYGICKIFVLCDNRGGSFSKNIETLDSRFFKIDEIPELALEKNNMEQIRMCFTANRSETWDTIFD